MEADAALRDRVERTIRRHLGDPTFSSTALAEGLGVSRSGLYRLLMKAAGEPPGRMIRNARLREGARLLRSTENRIAAIARRVGYTDPAHFTRSFKRRFGVPPTVYRSRNTPEDGPI